MVEEGCCPQCPAMKQAWPCSSSDKWCLLGALLTQNDAFLVTPSLQSNLKHSQGWAWFIGLVKPITMLSYFRLKVQRCGARCFSLMCADVGSGWHVPGGWPHSIVPLILPPLVLGVLRGTHVPVCSCWLCLKGSSLCKHSCNLDIERWGQSLHPSTKWLGKRRWF